MAAIDLDPQPINQPLQRPETSFVTPGFEDVAERPSMSSVLGATFRAENVIGSGAAAEYTPGAPDPDFNSFEAIRGTKYEQHWPSFVEARNETQLTEMQRNIDREEQDRKTIAAAPLWMSLPASLIANVTDPSILAPGGAFVRGSRGGFALAQTGASVGAAAAGATALQEVGLQTTQQLRTPVESAFNVGASAILGGMLGVGGASLLSRPEWAAAVKAIDDEVVKAPVPEAMTPGSAGAAATPVRSIGEMSIAGTAASGVAAATRKLNPGLRIAQSEVPEVRDVGFNLFEMSQYIRGNQDGLATPVAVETLRKEWDAGLARSIYDMREAYKDFRKGGGAMSRLEFQEAVGRAMRRSDEDAIPQVAAAAKAWRSNIFDPLKDAAIKAKILPEDVSVDTAASYFSRLWNRNRLVAEEGAFKGVVQDWVARSTGRWMADFDADTARRAAKLDGDKLKEFEAQRSLERESRFGDDPGGMGREVANEVFDKLVGRAAAQSGTRPEFITVNARGPLKERTFNIPDELVERWLENDVEQVGRRYQRIMSADVELASKFGTPDMAEAIQKIRDGYNKLRAGETDERRLMRLAAAEKSDIGDIEAVRDIIRGNFAQADWERSFGSIVRIANAVQYILKMGGVVLSSLTEPVRVVAAKGLTPFMQTGLAAMANTGAVKLSIKEAQLAGNIYDKVLANRLYTLADLGDFYSSRGPIEKFMDNMTNVASKWNGIRVWTDGVKMLSSTMIQNQIIESVTKYASGSKGARYLNHLGIDESMAGRIAKQFEEYGETLEGVRVAGTERWTDEVARRTYRAALNKDLDSMVVTRGASDLPLFANTPLGKLLFQFNTFNLASHQRVLLRGLQEDKARLLSGVIALSAMGMLQTYLGALASNRLDKLPNMAENPGWWIAEGLDRSGVFSIFFQIANASEKLTGINPIKYPIKKVADAGDSQSERMRNRNELSAVLGPTAGTLQDVGAVLGMAKTVAEGGEITKGQQNAGERLLPFNSYAGVRQFLKYFVNPPAD